MAAFYLVSSPLHLLNACAIALNRPSQNNILLFINYPEKHAELYREGLNSTPEKPFNHIEICAGSTLSSLQKRKQCAAVFRRLSTLAKHYKPSIIYVGNDREVESQYLIQLCKKANKHTRGIYIDDGLFSYIGRAKSKRWQEQIVDQLLKKIFYGLWYHTPKTIGASKWIDDIYVAFPAFISPELQNKTIHQLPVTALQSSTLRRIATHWVNAFLPKQTLITDIQQCDIVLTLPDSKDIRQIPQYKEKITCMLDQLNQASKRIMVKYHPNSSRDELDLCRLTNVSLIPAQLPFEALIPLLPNKAILLGDMTSTLITTHIIRPNIQKIVIKFDQSNHFKPFQQLFEKFNFTMLPSEQIPQALLV